MIKEQKALQNPRWPADQSIKHSQTQSSILFLNRNPDRHVRARTYTHKQGEGGRIQAVYHYPWFHQDQICNMKSLKHLPEQSTKITIKKGQELTQI